jgi:hypothetical protein
LTSIIRGCPGAPGLELVGLAVGKKRTLVVPALQAYGPYDPGRIRRLARARFAEHKTHSVGEWVRVLDRRRRLIRIVDIRENMVVVDTNHHWAGHSLELEVEVLTIHGPEGTSAADNGGEGHTPDPRRGLRGPAGSMTAVRTSDRAGPASIHGIHALFGRPGRRAMLLAVLSELTRR